MCRFPAWISERGRADLPPARALADTPGMACGALEHPRGAIAPVAAVYSRGARWQRARRWTRLPGPSWPPFDPLDHPFPSRRVTVFARNGMVATSQPLAAAAGLRALLRGGNAVDAAVAAAAALTVVEPTSNGIGGDAFALICHGGALFGLNASGPAPAALSRQALTAQGLRAIPARGWIPVTVPGAPAAWAQMADRFGRLPLTSLLEPAVAYAEEGYPLSPVLAHYWEAAVRAYRRAADPGLEPWFATFAPLGRAPRAGEIWRAPGHARTLRAIAESRARAFYQGELAERMDQASRAGGGFLRASDLAAFQPEWVSPVSIPYGGHEVWELPPNGQGLVALMALRILSGWDLASLAPAASLHLQLEAIKLAFADGQAAITDPRAMAVAPAELLSGAYAEERRRAIGTTAGLPTPGNPPRGDTVYVATADSAGTMVSYIQSNYMGFGSGMVVPDTGISLQNRGHTFSLDPADANCLEPGKRTYHTLMPGFLTRGGVPVGPFGVMGGFMQPQGHVQVVVHTLNYGRNPQACLDAPRWQWLAGRQIALEDFPEAVVADLRARGHDVTAPRDPASFGRGEIIWRDPESGVLAGASEPRTDGTVAAF